MSTIHDITVTLGAGRTPLWPGDPPTERSLVWQIGAASDANVSRLSMSVHTGTHVDAPYHYLADGAGADTLDLNVLVGPCCVCAVQPAGALIAASDLAALHVPATCRRLLLKTRNSSLWAASGATFTADFVSLAPDGAAWIVQHGIRLIAIDYLSVEPPGCTAPVVHRTLLAAGVVILEGIDLSAVAPGSYTLACLPLKLAGSDGAPARAILIEQQGCTSSV